MIDDDEYRFAIGDTEVILDLWDDDIVLILDQAIRVTGELERTDADDQAAGFLYELDATWIEDADGSRIGDDDEPGNGSSDEDDLKATYGSRATGTLAELIALLQADSDDDLNVRVTGTLGERIDDPFDDDDYDFLFSDDSGVTVLLDLDSRADVRFAFAPGVQLDIIGELERIDDDDSAAPAGVTYEIDAVWVRLVDGTSLDIGQLTTLAGATISDWLGYFWKLDDSGWYDHPTKGLIHKDGAFDDDEWLFNQNRDDWTYVDRSLYPLVYCKDGGWYYLIGSPYGEQQHAFSFEQGTWVIDFWNKDD
jgi:hypothetical protein